MPIEEINFLVGRGGLPPEPGSARKMGDLKSVRRFEYRPCRIAMGFDVDFVSEGEMLHGICRDVSDSGIQAAFDGSVTVGSSGLLILQHEAGALKLKAKVAYIEKSQVGLVFLFKTPEERARTSEYVASITNHAAASRVIQFFR
jgi:hypothetical protein